MRDRPYMQRHHCGRRPLFLRQGQANRLGGVAEHGECPVARLPQFRRRLGMFPASNMAA